jgi:hypothetical protein
MTNQPLFQVQKEKRDLIFLIYGDTMKKQERDVGDLVSVIGTDNLGIILKVHDKAGDSKFYLVYDNTTHKEQWLQDSFVFDIPHSDPNVELFNNKA